MRILPLAIYLRPATRFVAGFIGQASFVPCRVESVVPGSAQVTLAGDAARAGGAAPGCRAGSEAVLMLRPEHVKLSAGDPGTPGSFPARVVEEVFQGAVVRYGLEAAERARLTANNTARRSPGPGGRR